MSIEFRDLAEAEREACLDLWCTVWPGENSRAYFRRYFYGDVEWLPYYTQVAAVDGKLVSAVQICKRTVACGEFQLTMGGIANVATLPEFRGQGYNTECLKRAIAVMEADAMDFSLLFTGIQDYYARLGYEVLPRRQISGTIRAEYTPRPSAYTVRPATEADLPSIHAVYEAYNAHRPIAVQRSGAYWRDWLRIAPGSVPNTLLVATKSDGQAYGYVQTGVFNSAAPYSADEVGLRVIELGMRVQGPGVEQEVTQALLEALGERMIASGMRRMRLDIALEQAVLDALDPILEDRQEHFARSGMVRLLHRENLLKSFTIPLNGRWIAAGRPPGEIAFGTPYGSIRLDANGPFLRVTPEDPKLDDAPQSALFGLLFGAISLEQTALLRSLFPPQAWVYWGADGF
ncbi:MAG TPA: GNAT family N-acetyltransferase [Chthonomonadaceae bacterium]|nr:GNAT family N-acetyltransferase [Chthonomonadaceae bacterium]